MDNLYHCYVRTYVHMHTTMYPCTDTMVDGVVVDL